MLGKALIGLGVVLVFVGLAMQYAPWLVNWFGRLPGDINITRDGGRVFIPITSMVLVSVALTIVLNVFFRR
jgi:predicted Na+-dependent transporter